MKWNLKEFFKNENDCENFANELLAKSAKFSGIYKGKLATLSPDKFNQALSEYENLNEDNEKIGTYAYLSFAIDSTKGGFLAKFEKICDEISQNLLFFELEFCDLDTKISQNFLKNSGRFEYFLSLLLKQKSHQLSLAEESVLLKTSSVGMRAFSRLFDESMTNMKFKFNGEILGEEKILSLLSSTDRNTRKKAALALSKGLKANSHILTFIFNMMKSDAKTRCELRKYALPEEIMHEHNQTTKQSVDALITATENNFALVGEYYDKKRKILGLKKLYDYDRYAPFGDEKEMSFDQAKDIVLKAFSDFSPKFGEIAKMAFKNSWIDANPSPNKVSGAFSHSSVKSTHPFVMLNFTNKRRDLFTLAHELGHAIHQYLAYSVGYFYQSTPLTTAETASVFCEMVVFEYELAHTKDNAERLGLIGGKLEDIFATLYRQIGFTTFERRFHAASGELSTAEISEIWMQESRKMFDGKLELNEYYSLWWSYIPHFIHTPFYCYSYGYAQLLVLALFGLYKSKKCENFTEIYTKFLSLGGSKSPQNLVAMFGLDINSSEFWELGLNEIKKLASEFCK